QQDGRVDSARDRAARGQQADQARQRVHRRGRPDLGSAGGTVSHAAPDRAWIETGGGFSGTGRHSGGGRPIRGPRGALRPRGSRASGASGASRGQRGSRQRGGAEQAEDSRFTQLPYLAVMVGVGIALLIISQGVHLVRSGTLVLAGVLLIAAMARLVLPE